MSGECNICGVMGCVESNHKEPPVIDAKPYEIPHPPFNVHQGNEGNWFVLGRGMHTQCRDRDDAQRVCNACNNVFQEANASGYASGFASGAASRDGEVGRLRDELDRIAKAEGYIPSLRDTHRWYKPVPSVTEALRAASEAFGGAASALAPGNGGEGEKK